MANSLGTNPIVLDTSGSTNLAQDFPVEVAAVMLTVGSAGGTATIKDAAGDATLFEAANPTVNSTLFMPLPKPLRLSNNGPTSPGWQLSALPAGAKLLLFL